MSLISTPESAPSVVAAESARPGSSVCTCARTSSPSLTTTRQSPSGASRTLEQLARERAGDQEAGAVARSVVIGRDRLVGGGHDRGDLLDGIAAQGGERAAHELDETGAAGVDHAGLAQHGSSSGVRASAASAAASAASTVTMTSLEAAASAPSASARATVRMVPSTGSRSAASASVLARRSASAIAWPSSGPPSPRRSQSPRTSCERMIPELPRAPRSAARAPTRAIAEGSGARFACRASTTERAVWERFAPVSPSGTG